MTDPAHWSRIATSRAGHRARAVVVIVVILLCLALLVLFTLFNKTVEPS